LSFKFYLHSPTHISEFVLYGINLSYDKTRIVPIFVCRAVRHLANMYVGQCKYLINNSRNLLQKKRFLMVTGSVSLKALEASSADRFSRFRFERLHEWHENEAALQEVT
jgi:hypothetical protein